MILKALLIGAVIYIVYIMFFKQKNPQNRAKKQNTQEETPLVDEMVECTNCGVYVEISEAILSNGKYYCSKECMLGVKN